MSKYREWDWNEIISAYCKVREKPMAEELATAISEELQRLNFHGWNTVCQVVDGTLEAGKYALSEKLWKIVRDAVNEKIAEIRGGKEKKCFTPKYQQSGYSLTSLTKEIDNEIELWHNANPPYKYKGTDVLKREKFYSPERFDLEQWARSGMPELDSILKDEYFKIFHESVTHEELVKQDGKLQHELSCFLERLTALRTAQTKIRNDEAIAKIREQKEVVS